jgi:hypothetical protein
MLLLSIRTTGVCYTAEHCVGLRWSVQVAQCAALKYSALCFTVAILLEGSEAPYGILFF